MLCLGFVPSDSGPCFWDFSDFSEMADSNQALSCSNVVLRFTMWIGSSRSEGCTGRMEEECDEKLIEMEAISLLLLK
jgi:hypothetical protein